MARKSTIYYILKEDRSPHAKVWVSSGIFKASNLAGVKKVVASGWREGENRWAEGTDGSFIFGIDRQGKHVLPKKLTLGRTCRDPNAKSWSRGERDASSWSRGTRRDPNVANTILEQLGGRRFIAMTGAKNLTSDKNSLMFKIPKAKSGITHVKITLDPSDTYTVRFIKQARAPSFAVTTVKEYNDIYADQLQDLFMRTTGLYTNL